MIPIRRWASLNPQTMEAIICTSYQRLREKQVRQCQATWQLNPHRGLRFLSSLACCWNIAALQCVWSNTHRYLSNIILTGANTFKSEQRDNSDEFMGLELLSAALGRATRQLQHSKLNRNWQQCVTNFNDRTRNSWFAYVLKKKKKKCFEAVRNE